MTNEQIEILKLDIASIDNLSLEEVNSLRKKYQKAINEAHNSKKKKEPSKKESKAKEKSWTYPFIMYFGHQYRDVTGFFEEGKSYTETEITKILCNHGYKEFKYAAEVKYEYFEDENCLYPKLKVGNRG